MFAEYLCTPLGAALCAADGLLLVRRPFLWALGGWALAYLLLLASGGARVTGLEAAWWLVPGAWATARLLWCLRQLFSRGS